MVLRMASGLPAGGGYVLYFDNFFTSIPLLISLKRDHGFGGAGTLRTNRKGVPANFALPKRAEQGDSRTRYAVEEEVTLVSWKDKKVLNLASNCHGARATTVKRRQHDGVRKDVPAPEALQDYNQHMGGVDLTDFLRSLYPSGFRSPRWWLPLFWWTFDMAISNACILRHKARGTSTPDMLSFRTALAGLLVGGYSGRKRTRDAGVGVGHYLVKTRTSSSYSHKRCVMCRKSGIVKKTLFECNACRKPLCVTCEKPFHAAMSS